MGRRTKKRLQRFTVNVQGNVRREKLEGKWHTVVPAVNMMLEGVWEGSQGPLLYERDHMRPVTPRWNHMPVVVYHPDEGGVPVTARKPSVMNSSKVGLVLNTKYKSGWQADLWINEARANKVDKRILKDINSKKGIEGSTGIFTYNYGSGGKKAGKRYDATATNIDPDHFALLPDKEGACSLKDGCGITANAAAAGCKCGLKCGKCKEDARRVYNKDVGKDKRKYRIADNHLPRGKLTINGKKLTNNNLSFQEVSRALSDLLSAEYGRKGKSWYGYVCDVYPDKVIFWNEDGNMYSQSYTNNGTTVKLTGTAEQVVRVSEYRTTDGKAVVNSGYKPIGGKGVTTNEKKKAIISRLIKNGKFLISDREVLMDLPIKTLRRMKEQVTVPPTVNVHNHGQSVPTTTKKKKKAGATTNGKGDEFQNWVNTNVPPMFRPVMNSMKAHYDGTKANLIEAILAVPVQNEAAKFSKEFLGTKDVPELQGVLALATAGQPQQVQNELPPGAIPMFQTGTFIGAGGYVPTTNAAGGKEPVAPLEDPEFDWSTKQQKKKSA